MTMVVERATGLSDDEFEKWRQWIEAGAVLQVAEDAKKAEAAASEPVLELDADDYLEAETYDEPIPADEAGVLPAETRRAAARPLAPGGHRQARRRLRPG